MARLGGTFDASTVDPTSKFEVVPPNKYTVHIVASEMKPTKDGTGEYLQLEEEILDGQYAGRKLWDRLNLKNANAQTVEIAQRQLSQICHAIGVMSVTDSEQLHFKRMVADVRVKPPQGQYAETNEIKGYAPVNGAAMLTTQAGAASQPPANKTAPWRR